MRKNTKNARDKKKALTRSGLKYILIYAELEYLI
jgi:hypothetical protein